MLVLLIEERSYRNPVSVGNGPGIDVSCFPTHETFIKARLYRQGEQTQGSGHADERGQRKKKYQRVAFNVYSFLFLYVYMNHVN